MNQKKFHCPRKKLKRSSTVRTANQTILALLNSSFNALGIEDQLIDDPRNIIYDSNYFELKDLLR